jgi:uncharacterized protein (DUF305 family)
MSNSKSTREILFSYFSYIILFIGSAFVSGAIVHSGNVAEIPKYTVIGILGVSLFIAGSFLQEYIVNKDTTKQGGVLKFFLFSLLLSIGIGMISGGTQHFTDFPIYSSYLIPLGLILSLVAFLLKNNFFISTKAWATIIGIFVLISIPLHFGLMTYANSIKTQKTPLCATKIGFIPLVITVAASGGDHQEECLNNKFQDKMTGGMIMDKSSIVEVKDDKSFIEYVIPHHQDAVDGSNKVLATTQDPELKAFVNNVIKTQGQEITLLKGYYKTWFGKDYVDNGSYKAMMRGTKSGVEADKEYIAGMLGHHSGIIDIAKMVLVDSKFQFKPEILTLSKQIIKDQKADNIVLNRWLVEKYNGQIMETPHDESVPH